MTAVQLVNVLRHFGLDVLLLALGVTLITSILKKTVLKSFPNKVYVFLPFLLGLILYATYRCLALWSISPLTGDIRTTVEGGLSCGSAATLYYVVYEQFFRRKKTIVNPLLPLLEGIVPEGETEEAAAALYEGSKSAAELLPFVRETLLQYVDDSLSEAEFDATCQLIADFLSTL